MAVVGALRMHKAVGSITYALALALLAVLALTACRSTPAASQAPPAQSLELPRFMGTWYVVARIPNVIERGHMAARIDYSLRDDGKIAVRYSYRTGPAQPVEELNVVGSVVPGTGNRQWRMRFFRVVPTTQRVLEVAPDDSWALLDVPGRDLAWIYARAPTLTDAQYLDLRSRLSAHGVNVDKVWRVVQRKDDVGRRGFDQPDRP